MTPITLDEMVVAYKKAKVDLFYASDPRLLDLVEYEENLGDNLRNLRSRVLSRDETWVKDPAFVGGTFTLSPKEASKALRPGGANQTRSSGRILTLGGVNTQDLASPSRSSDRWAAAVSIFTCFRPFGFLRLASVWREG